MQNKKDLFGATGFFIVIVLFFCSLPSTLFAQDTCVSCHSQLKDPYLKKVFSVWEESIHHDLAAGCQSCHSGNNQTTNKNVAHGSMKKITGANANPICGDCHTEIFEHYQESAHYKKSTRRKTPTCVTCHSPKSGFTVPIAQFDSLCLSCHAQRGEKAEMIIVKAKGLHTFYLNDLAQQFEKVRGAMQKAKMQGVSTKLAEDIQVLAEGYATHASSTWHTFDMVQYEKELKKAFYLSQEAENLLKEEQ